MNKKPSIPAAEMNARDPKKAYSDLKSKPTQARSGRNLKTMSPTKEVQGRKVC